MEADNHNRAADGASGPPAQSSQRQQDRPLPGELTTVVPVLVEFPCVMQEYDRKKFQAAGHFVSGSITGERVFCVTLNNITGPLSQVLRVQGNNHAEACDAMSQAIYSLLFTQDTASRQRAFDYEAYQALNARQNRLAEFIAANYAWEAYMGNHQGLRSPVDVAIYHLQNERRRWWVRLAHWMRRLVVGMAAPPIPSTVNETQPDSDSGVIGGPR